MAYELSGSIEAGNVVATRVRARTGTGTFVGSMSPDGTMVAVRSAKRFGRGGIVDQGVDVWHSSSTGWNEVDSVDTDAFVRGVMWLTNNEFLVVASDDLYSFKSGSSGWSEAYKNLTGIGDSQRIYPNADGTKLAIAEQVFETTDTLVSSPQTRRTAIMTSGSGGYTNTSSEVITIDSLAPITDLTWVDDSNILFGVAGQTSATGQVRHYQSGSSGWSLISFINGQTSTDGLRYLGSMVHYHTGSNTIMIGGAGAAGGSSTALKGYINLMPSGSSSLLPNNSLVDILGAITQTIDLGAQGLTADSDALTTNDAPYHLDGNTLSVDPTNGDRFVVASAVISSAAEDGRVFITAESGSSGWKFNQLNPEGDGLMKLYPLNGWGHQLSAGATRYVGSLTGSVDNDVTEGFTVYDTGLSVASGGGDPASFTLTPSATPLSLTEGSTGTVGVVLGKQPTSDVVISISLAGSLSGRASLNKTTLTFTNSNWNTQQDVTVTATANNIDDDNATGNITFSVVDASSDDEFDSLADQTVALTVVDNDTAGFTLTPSVNPLKISENGTGTISVKLDAEPASGNVVIDITAAGSLSGRATLDKNRLTFDNTNWNVNQVVQISGVSDEILRNDSVGNVTFAVNNGLTAHTKFHNLSDAVTVTIEDDETASIVLTPSSNPFAIDEGATGTITAVLGKEPAGTVKVDIALPAQFSGRATADKTSFTFDNTNWNNATAHTVTITATPDNIDNDPITNNITFSVDDTATTLDKFKALALQTVATTIRDDDTASFTLTPSVSPFKIQESKSGIISVVLGAEPRTGTVQINVQLENSLSSRAALSDTSLTFTKANWNQVQDVTITATDNNSVDGNATGNITFSVDNSSSVEFQSLANQEVSTTIEDDDTSGFVFAPGTFLSTTEQGATAELSVKLSAQPASDVTVKVTIPDPDEFRTEGRMDPDPVNFTFTTETWNDFQIIRFTGIDDVELDGDITYEVVVSSESNDSNFNNLTQTIKILNVDSGNFNSGGGGPSSQTPPSGDDELPPEEEEGEESTGASFPAASAGGRGRGRRRVKTQADFLPRKVHFEPSTIETIDRSVLSYMENLDLFANSNEGWKKVPIIWASAERAYQVKKNKDLRDDQGMLRFPIISVKRSSIVKDMGSKGVFQGNVPEIDKFQGGSLTVGRVIYQEKTSKFASADALRLHKQSNYPRPNPKVVYRTITAPMPVNVTVMYEITIRTEYQQQMNDLILPFVTTPGTINYITLAEGEHRFEGFIQGDFQNADNLSNFSTEERKFEVKIPLKVIAYLVGQEDNRDKPHYSVRENAVEVKIPRERISLNEIPEHEYGSYYGLSGVPEPVFIAGFSAPFLFSNVPATQGSTNAGTNSGDAVVSSNVVTRSTFSSVLSENLVIREILKQSEDAIPSPANSVTVTTATVKENTESLFLNGAILAPGSLNDYTMTGQTINLNFDLDQTDVLFITYIKG